ncbi:MAG: type II toxin-antitoxin system Phd/YefM family antitoxin [Acetobacteraceae bacterium]|nr:type II toxin-antitoxin system Phd/YefM family antitoxin [Acetobacteraceae bacterium]
MDAIPDATQQTISATEFKARCLEILDRLAARELTRVSVTKRGKVVAVLTPPPQAVPVTLDDIYGFMRGSVIIPEGLDLTQPILEDPFEAESGRTFE